MSSKLEVAGGGSGPTGRVAAEALPDREVRNPLFRFLVHLGLPVSISLGLHLAILLFAAHYAIHLLAPPPQSTGEWAGTVVEADDLSGAFQWSNDKLLDALPDAPNTSSLESLTSPLSGSASVDLSELAKGTGSGGDDASGSGLGLGDGPLSLLGVGSGASEAGGGGFGGGLGEGAAKIGQAGIWNLNVRANRIAYVVDFSGSIIVAVDDLKRELKRSVGRLKPSQAFTVILFYSAGGGTDEEVKTESFKPKLEPADPSTRREFLQWIDRKAPMGVTEPLQAMKRALTLEPDVIFFFSDGYFDDAIVAEINRANHRHVRIFCLVFDDQLLGDSSQLPPKETEGSRRLRRIAEANGGSVKIVTGKDLRR